MRRNATALAFGLLLLLVLALPANAGRRWCAVDPIVTIDGTPVQIWVAVPEEYQAYVDDAIDVKIKAPKHLDRQVVFLDAGFNGHGEKVGWSDIKDDDPDDGLIPVAVEVKVKFNMKQLEKDMGKDALEAALGKGTRIPVQVVVNIGDVTESFETAVYYGTHKKTKFELAVFSATEASE